MNVTNETKSLLIDYWETNRKKNIDHFFKKGLLQIFYKIKSIVAFTMSELVIISKDGFPYRNTWVKEESVISSNL